MAAGGRGQVKDDLIASGDYDGERWDFMFFNIFWGGNVLKKKMSDKGGKGKKIKALQFFQCSPITTTFYCWRISSLHGAVSEYLCYYLLFSSCGWILREERE